MTVLRSALLNPDGEASFELIPDALTVVNDASGQLLLAAAFPQTEAEVRKVLQELEGGHQRIKSNDGVLLNLEHPVLWQPHVVLPGASNTHTHSVQPPAVEGNLVSVTDEGFEGWLPTTLLTESMVKRNPDMAKAIFKERLAEYIAAGTTSSLEYATSSAEVVRFILDEARESGFEGRIKVGFVAMDQGVNQFHDDIDLEVNENDTIREVESLLIDPDYKNNIVVIDRFPIAVTSPLRRRLAELARKHNVLFETHLKEQAMQFGEDDITRSMYGKDPVDVLFDDGVFKPDTKVGLAHAIHLSDHQIERLGRAVQNGCEIYVRACPDSNGQLGSHHLETGEYVSFPLKKLQEAGVKVTLGLDNGAGRGVNLFAEALKERARRHVSGVTRATWSEALQYGGQTYSRNAEGGRRMAARKALLAAARRRFYGVEETYQPSSTELLNMATVAGHDSLGVQSGFQVGSAANFVSVQPRGLSFLSDPSRFPQDVERVAGMVLEGAQDSRGLKQVFVDGKNLKA